MLGYQDVAIIAAFVVGYGLIAGRVERTALSGPIVFTAIGFVLGPSVLDVVALRAGSGELRVLAEATLALVLFTDAASTDLAALRRSYRLPARLLGLGLPLTIGMGLVLAAVLLDGLIWAELALLAVILAPTDAALGAQVIADERVPEACREALNVESGLNDGICVPVFLALLGLAVAESEGGSLQTWIAVAVEEIGLGAAVGAAVGAVGALALRRAHRNGWTTTPWADNVVLGLALLCFAAPQWLGGSGFIGAFVGGLTMRALAGPKARHELGIGVVVGDLLALVTWMLFGGAIVGILIAQLDPRAILYALASLTLVRMLPVAVALAGQGLRWDTILFLGWFGPRGLASVVFAALAFQTPGLAGSLQIVHVAAWTILLSILLHGITATPLATWYGKRCAARGGTI